MLCPAGEPLPVVRSFPRPLLYTQILPKYNYLPETAPSPVRDSIVTYETMETERDIILDSKDPFGSSGIASLQSYVKRGRGLAWQNRSSSKLHYETNHRVFDEHTRPKAKLLKIRHHIFYPDGGTVRQVVTGRDNAFIIVSGGTFADFHDKVCFQALIRDACIPAVNTIPKQDPLRMNSGPTVGLSSSQGTTRSAKQGFATPNFIRGTPRYSKIFGIASETTRKLLKHCRLSWLLPPTGPHASRKQLSYQRRCEELCQGNLYLALSFKIYVHHPANIDNHAGHFSAHRDIHNPHYTSPNDIFFTAWDTWFEPLLNLYVTGTIIFCGRRSQEELYDRILKIGRATEEILSRAQSLPISRRSIHPDMLCPSDVEFMTKGSHLLQIHALTPNEYIYQLSMVLGGNQGLSAFLATEIILGYHQTSNNALRFHRFMNQLLSSVQQHRDLRFLGQLNVIEAYQQYCYDMYGSFEGTTNRNGLREGIVRHQPSHTSPISHYANWYCLQALISSLKSNGSGTVCNQRRYESLVKQLKSEVIGLGDLKAQKTVMNFASLGLFISLDFMSMFYTGSTQQLKNMKDDPFNFNRADEVTQLRRNLCVRMSHLLPMQADEFICALTSGQKKKSKEETTGEVYYRKQSIFNASRKQDGTISLQRFNWSQKRNEPAPNIRFNYSPQYNHYIPKWAACINGQLPGSALVSLCSQKNMTNTPTVKSGSSVLDFTRHRDIAPDDFQRLLSVGLYVVVSDLLIEVSDYLGCSESELTRAIRIRRASHNGGYTSDVDLNFLRNTSTKNIFGTPYATSHQSKVSVLIKTLISVKVDGTPWAQKFFVGHVNGFLLLLQRAESECFCDVTAFVYMDDANRRVKCCMLNETGSAATTFSSHC